jgi:hypothetical protein
MNIERARQEEQSDTDAVGKASSVTDRQDRARK